MGAVSKNPDHWPVILPGFEHVTRAWDSNENACSSKIAPGEYYVTHHDEIITTVLGSCVAACIRDPIAGIGGMNHFMLPQPTGKDMSRWGGQACLETRYGLAAMETLINDILKQGARIDRLEVKLFGGGNVLAMDFNSVGEQNVEFVRNFAKAEGLNVVAEDFGGPHPRKLNYFPKSGRVLVKRLRPIQRRMIGDCELQYKSALAKKPISGGIELFD